MLKRKCQAIMKALACERHSRLPDPVDRLRFRQNQQVSAQGHFQDLPQQSKLVPVYQDEPSFHQMARGGPATRPSQAAHHISSIKQMSQQSQDVSSIEAFEQNVSIMAVPTQNSRYEEGFPGG